MAEELDDQRREERHENQEDDDHGAGDGDAVLLQPIPGDAAQGPPLDRLARGRREGGLVIDDRSESVRLRCRGSQGHEFRGPLPQPPGRGRWQARAKRARAASPGPSAIGNRSVVSRVDTYVPATGLPVGVYVTATAVCAVVVGRTLLQQSTCRVVAQSTSWTELGSRPLSTRVVNPWLSRPQRPPSCT